MDGSECFYDTGAGACMVECDCSAAGTWNCDSLCPVDAGAAPDAN
jgi:hypothetical protein